VFARPKWKAFGVVACKLQMDEDELVVSVAAACLQSVISLLHPIGKSIGLTIITGVAIPLMRGSLRCAPP
jgi:hypothetical protein